VKSDLKYMIQKKTIHLNLLEKFMRYIQIADKKNILDKKERPLCNKKLTSQFIANRTSGN